MKEAVGGRLQLVGKEQPSPSVAISATHCWRTTENQQLRNNMFVRSLMAASYQLLLYDFQRFISTFYFVSGILFFPDAGSGDR